MLDAKQLFRCMCAMTGLFPRLILEQKHVDAIFVWGRAADEWQASRFDDGVLKVAAKLHRQTGAPVVIPRYVGSVRGQGLTGYPGPMVWQEALAAVGVSRTCIRFTVGRGINTKTEFDDFVDLAKAKKWTTVAAVTQPAHALRAMLGAVRSMTTKKVRTLTVVPVWAHLFDWTRACHGSQGQGPYPRLNWIDEEFSRIPRYRRKGHLATLRQLWTYLEHVYQQIDT